MNSEYFKKEEFTCKCGCGTNNISKDLKERSKNARELAGIPFHLTSACRCEKHNKNVGGVENSSHLTTKTKECTAIDVRATNSRSRYLIVYGMIRAGFNRIGIAKTFVHGDVDPTKAPGVIWLY